MIHHTIDWRERGTIAAVQWCEWEFLGEEEVVLQDNQSARCPRCKGMLYHNGEFRTVTCKKEKGSE